MTLSNRGWKRPAPTNPPFPRGQVRRPRRSHVFTPTQILAVLALLVLIVLMLPRHITIGGYHVHPGFAPYLTPYLFG
jgi:hypothetical protein